MNRKKEIFPLDKATIRSSYPKLYEAIGENSCYLLQKNSDNSIVVMISDLKNETLKLIKDFPKINNEKNKIFNRLEEYSEIEIKLESFGELIDFFVEKSNMRLVSAANNTGRPSKYNIDDAKRIAKYKKEGTSIRKIAQKEKMSPTTVQKLLRKYETMAAFSESENL